MGHNITAVVASSPVISRLVDAAECPTPTELGFGLWIAPLGHHQIDRLTQLKPGAHTNGFVHLSEGLKRALLTAADGETMVYLETEYFGGAGSQAAAFFYSGDIVFQEATDVDRKPSSRSDPINTALRALGVKAHGDVDEFDAVGLGRFRDLESLGLDQWDDD